MVTSEAASSVKPPSPEERRERLMGLVPGKSTTNYGATGFHPYASKTCIKCGGSVCGPVSRVGWLLHMHANRCDTATAEERAQWRKTGRWPRKATCGGAL